MKVTIFLFAILFSSQVLAKKEVKHLRLIWQDNPMTETYVAWTTKGLVPTFGNRVCYDTAPKNGKIELYSKCKKAYLQKPVSYGFSMVHGVKLKDLTPGTKYYFVVKSGKTITKEFNFITAPASGNFELLIGGDSRSDVAKRQDMNKLMRRQFEANPNIYALVHGGDFINNGFSWKQWKQWFDDHQLTTTADNRILPVIPTRGNHEMSRMLFNDLWLFPGKLFKNNYYTSHFSNLDLINLNTNIICGGPQKRWLKKELKKSAASKKWILANYHRPAFPAVKKPGRARKHWVPLFEDFQIDLAIESDGHTLKRTAPIYREKVDHVRGITYVGEGGLGVSQRTPKRKNEWYFQAPGYALSAYHVMKLSVTPNQMTLDVVLGDGSVFDSIVMKPRNRSNKSIAKR